MVATSERAESTPKRSKKTKKSVKTNSDTLSVAAAATQEESEATSAEAEQMTQDTPELFLHAAETFAAIAEMEASQPDPFQCVAGGAMTKHKALFAPDASLYFSLSYRYIHVHDTQTGTRLRTLKGHTQEVTCMAINPKNPQQLITSSLDGTLRYWSYDDGTLLRVIPCYAPIHSLVLSPTRPNTVLLGLEDVVLGHFAIAELQLSSDVTSTQSTYPTLLCDHLEEEIWQSVVFHPTVDAFAYIQQQTLCYHAYQPNSESQWQSLEWPVHSLAHRLAFHPTKPLTVVGQRDGSMSLYTFPFDQWETLASLKTLSLFAARWHWHAHQVNTMVFSTDSHYLLSGGQEGVLVQWKLSNGEKSFLPRFASPIEWLVPHHEGRYLLAGTAANDIAVVDLGTGDYISRVAGVQIASLDDETEPVRASVAFHAPTSSFVLPGASSSVQLFSPTLNQVVEHVAVAGVKYLSSIDTDKVLLTPIVEHTAVSDDGHWLASVTWRESTLQTLGATLRFFEYSTDAPKKDGAREGYTQPYGHFKLHTTVEILSKDCPVTALAFQPQCGKDAQVLVMTTTSDCRVWQTDAIAETFYSAQQTASVEHPTSHYKWRHTSTFQLGHAPNTHHHREEMLHQSTSLSSLTPTCATFTGDGSMLLLGTGGEVSVWETASWTPLPSLFGGFTQAVMALCVVGSHVFVARGEKTLHYLDLLDPAQKAHVIEAKEGETFCSQRQHILTPSPDGQQLIVRYKQTQHMCDDAMCEEEEEEEDVTYDVLCKIKVSEGRLSQHCYILPNVHAVCWAPSSLVLANADTKQGRVQSEYMMHVFGTDGHILSSLPSVLREEEMADREQRMAQEEEAEAESEEEVEEEELEELDASDVLRQERRFARQKEVLAEALSTVLKSKARVVRPNASQPLMSGKEQQAALLQLFSAPSHAAPPLQTLCQKFMSITVNQPHHLRIKT